MQHTPSRLWTWIGWCLAVTLPLLAGPARAEAPRFFELEGFSHFLDGNPESTAVTEDGAIALPPEVQERYSDAAATFGAAAARGDDVFVSKVDDGQVVAIDKAGKTRNVYKAEEAMVTALLATDEGLFIAAGAPAHIYRIDSKGRAALYNAPEASYVWGMVEGP